MPARQRKRPRNRKTIEYKSIAQAKRRTNIAEYILYLWQLEDLLRALQFSPEAIWSQLVASQAPGEEEKQNNLLMWYMDVGSLLREEGKEKTGHLDHTLHLIGDLHTLHEQLLQAPAGERYRTLYARLQPELPRLREMTGRQDISDTELAFRTLYAAMLYRIKGDKTKESSISDAIELVSPVIGELARIFHLTENGELDIWEQKNG